MRVKIMLTNKDISDLYNKMDALYLKYRSSYFDLKRDFFKYAESNDVTTKYSAGGTIYPTGKYYWEKSKLYRKVVRESPGNFCNSIEGANFVYIFSGDGRLLTYNKIYQPHLNKEYDLRSTSVSETGFLIYDGDHTYVLPYHEANELFSARAVFPELSMLGIIINKDNCEIMAECDVPFSSEQRCECLEICVIDNENNNEYFYSLYRIFFEYKYDLTSDEEYPVYSTLNK